MASIKQINVGGTTYDIEATGITKVSDTAITSLALEDNHEYYLSSIGDITFTFPESTYWECWARIELSDAESHAITLPDDAQYIGSIPEWEASTVYEMSVKDGIVIVQKVGNGA